MYQRFGLTLTVTHACNLRCSYCYTGDKSSRTMGQNISHKSIDRAIASLAPEGVLELGFFGGEPLLASSLVASSIDYARTQTAARGMGLTISMTTNGTIIDPQAWSIMMLPDLNLAVSYDGLPSIHDQHRRTADGRSSSEQVLSTIHQLLGANRGFHVVMVVRPDTVDHLNDGVRFLLPLGVRDIQPTLDVWATWTSEDVARLERAIADCAKLWREGIPDLCIGWFDEKAAQLGQVPIQPTARCGFGDGEIAVAPSGRLYPCERLIGEDSGESDMILPGHAFDGNDFLNRDAAPARSDQACDECAMLAMCNTSCRCSNYVRTGDITKPDGLLCAWNQACLTETANVLKQPLPSNTQANKAGELS